jgi:hypothetical protein
MSWWPSPARGDGWWRGGEVVERMNSSQLSISSRLLLFFTPMPMDVLVVLAQLAHQRRESVAGHQREGVDVRLVKASSMASQTILMSALFLPVMRLRGCRSARWPTRAARLYCGRLVQSAYALDHDVALLDEAVEDQRDLELLNWRHAHRGRRCPCQ